MRFLLLLLLPLALAALLAAPAWSEDLIGRASVIDGDTIEIYGQRIRLWGMDAPEASQRCIDASGTQYRCGRDSALYLDAMLDGRTVTCEKKDIDRYKRIVAECFVDMDDGQTVSANALMTYAGHAVAYRRYSKKFIEAEDAARKARRGMWAGDFQMPWDWRRKR